jgi:hypothetical protein
MSSLRETSSSLKSNMEPATTNPIINACDMERQFEELRNEFTSKLHHFEAQMVNSESERQKEKIQHQKEMAQFEAQIANLQSEHQKEKIQHQKEMAQFEAQIANLQLQNKYIWERLTDIEKRQQDMDVHRRHLRQEKKKHMNAAQASKELVIRKILQFFF